MNTPQMIFERMRAIASAEDHNEAAGFVLDCILENGMEDDELGDAASLRPTDVVRDKEGNLQFVLCAVRPCEPSSLASSTVERILIGAAYRCFLASS